MRYRVDYSLSHDIDYFFRYENTLFHVASNGGIIPSFIESSINYQVQSIIYEMQEIYEACTVEDNVMPHLIIEPMEDMDSYCESFSFMARRGFVSMDRINMLNPNDQNFLVVSKQKGRSRVEHDEGLLRLIPDIHGIFHERAEFINFGGEINIGQIINGDMLFIDRL